MDRNHSSTPAADTPVSIERSTPERVLDTAAALFWQKGYAATTTREIAAAVGIQQASLYYHVASKEDLLYQLCVSSMEQLLAEVQSALGKAGDPMDRIRIFIRAHLNSLLKQQIRHINILTELRALSKPHLKEILALRKNYADLARSVLAEGQEAGVIRNDIPAKYLYLALLNILNWAVIWFRRADALAADQVAELFSMIYLDGAAASPQRIELTLPGFGKRPEKPAAKGRKPIAVVGTGMSQRLLDAAALLFSRKGYEATSTREIAAALRIQKASLYYHIESKEQLLVAICKSSLEQIRGDVEAAICGVAEPLDRIQVLVSTHIESMLRDQEKHSVAVAEMHLLSPSHYGEVRLLRDSYEGLVRSVLQAAQDSAVLRGDIPVKYLCLGLLGLMNRVEVWYRRNGALSPGEFGLLLAAIFLTGAVSRSRD